MAEPEAELRHVEAAYAALTGTVDVIHDHTELGPRRVLSGHCPVPVVATVHGPFTEDNAGWYARISERLPVVAISAAQAASAPSVNVAGVIHHGIDLDAFPVGSGRGGYVAFLGRMSPVKGPHRAIAAARAAGVPIRLAAKMWEPEERAYFESEVRPLLGRDAVYVGEVGGAAKAEFLGEALALLNPIRWPEPFGLNMVEALATGTPVLSFAEGAAPEIVADGVNGYLCRDVTAMAQAIRRVALLDRRACRSVAESRFSTARMVSAHVLLYRRAMKAQAAA